MDTIIRTLRLETSKRGRPKTPCYPNSAGSSQRDLNAPIPKNWASHLLRRECWIVRIGKRNPNWQWLKDKEREEPVKTKQTKICRPE